MDQGETNIVIRKTGEEKFATLLSYILHPLLMPVYGFALLFYSPNYVATFTPSNVKLKILLITFVFTFVLPTINALILLSTGRINSLEMETSKERSIPYGSAALYYFALFYLFYHQQFPGIFKSLVLGAAFSILLTWFINFKWKISAHTVGIGGTAGAALGVIYRLHAEMYTVFILLIFFSGILAYARLKLNAHTPSQVYSGFALGFIVELGIILFL